MSTKMADAGEDLTILLSLKDQAPFTWRWLRYADKTGLPFKVLIADGGKDPAVQSTLADKNNYPQVNYEYLQFPYDEKPTIFYQKIAGALGRVATPYVLLADNDDFYFPPAVKNSVKFLQSHPDYTSARGEVYDFTVKGDVYGSMTRVQRLYTQPSNIGATALARFESFSKYSNSSWHDVHPTPKLRQIFETLCQSQIEEFQLAEYFINMLNVVSGKVGRLDGLHMLHQARPNSLGQYLSRRDPASWILAPSWPKEFFTMIDTVAEQISRADKIASTEAWNKVAQYYLANTLGRKIFGANLDRRSSFPISNWPGLKTVKNLYLAVKSWRQEINNKKMIRQLPYYQEIDSIRNFLSHSS